MKNKEHIVAVSGGFDPIHIGHLDMIRDAGLYGDKVVVIVNNDNWLMDKKGFVFMPEKERCELIKGLKGVHEVYLTKHKKNDPDRSVCEALKEIKPQVFANGGDRKSIEDVPETKVCHDLRIEMIFNVGGGKVQSSSWLTGKLAAPVVQKPWGFMQTFRQENKWWVKTLTLKPGQRISLQSHEHRGEMWMVVEGEVFVELRNLKTGELDHNSRKAGEFVAFDPEIIHRATNKSNKPATFVEVVYGTKADEADIIRIQDDYGRI